MGLSGLAALKWNIEGNLHRVMAFLGFGGGKRIRGRFPGSDPFRLMPGFCPLRLVIGQDLSYLPNFSFRGPGTLYLTWD